MAAFKKASIICGRGSGSFATSAHLVRPSPAPLLVELERNFGGIASLQKYCKNNGLKFDDAGKTDLNKMHINGLISSKECYDVEQILDYARTGSQEWYFVKWAGWNRFYNSWEPKENLFCPVALQEFHKKLENKEIKQQKHRKRILEQKLGIKFKKMKPNNQISSKDYAEKKAVAKQALKEWETSINKLIEACPNGGQKIIVENDVDLEGPPQDFVYITDYKAANGIHIPSDPPIGCECADCFENRHECCPHQSGCKFAYTVRGRMRLPRGYPIYECNKRCHCGPDCANRVVQKGPPFKMSIFRTDDCRGWGVKTLQRILKGSFVMEYVGEVITHEEAEHRGLVYDSEGITYLFDLDFNVDDCPYTVDAGVYGNVAHFMNHSCDPNLVVYSVWIDNLDPRLPRLAFFATRDIRRGEELTFDYMMTGATEMEQSGTVSDRSSMLSESAPAESRSCTKSSTYVPSVSANSVEDSSPSLASDAPCSAGLTPTEGASQCGRETPSKLNLNMAQVGKKEKKQCSIIDWLNNPVGKLVSEDGKRQDATNSVQEKYLSPLKATKNGKLFVEMTTEGVLSALQTLSASLLTSPLKFGSQMSNDVKSSVVAPNDPKNDLHAFDIVSSPRMRKRIPYANRERIACLCKSANCRKFLY